MLFVGRLFMAMSLPTNVGKDVHGFECNGMKESSKLLRVVEKEINGGNVCREPKERRERDALGLDVGSKRLFHASLCGFPNWAIKVKTIMTETFFVY